MEKPTLPKGTRDFGPAVMAKRQFIFETIKGVFQKFGFQPLETPAMESLSTLTGKYGEEGDQLLFKILNSGDFLKDVDAATLESKNSKQLSFAVSEKGLRYDLTVPFARFVVMNRHEISFPFKRYQIQPVWRGDRPAKARYREFYQCDADVVGTDSLICEAEIILMITDVFKGLNITDYTIKINHRGILSGIAESIQAKQNETALFVAIDKLDKIGVDKVKEELRPKGFSEENLTALFDILNVKGSTTNKIAFLQSRFDTSENGQKGLRDLQEVFTLLKSYNASDKHVEFDVSLARGLSYYTGCIFEVKINHVGIGSVSGGGRYDNLTKAFGDKENLSGVGFSFGVDRIYDAMEELSLFSKGTQASSKVLVCHFDDDSRYYGLGVLSALREEGIASEIYPDQVKLKKQLDFANKKAIPYAIVIGPEEAASGQLAFKDMEKGEQQKLTLAQIISTLK
ncbi:histidine--tRNA ligase [Chryseolinea lacunae]|uniref:Histidine--tRNA ligase n=1 Tax=Chryseolinea lacunae TaxID=2801331 RepID=A0ABS1KX75_9BACT|nr:histidine--tRNA ligase [Chryseolinea lacunae]MBL0742896.1 histidine--tRNA ligase [Chryseolinea lacunae]